MDAPDLLSSGAKHVLIGRGICRVPVGKDRALVTAPVCSHASLMELSGIPTGGLLAGAPHSTESAKLQEVVLNSDRLCQFAEFERLRRIERATKLRLHEIEKSVHLSHLRCGIRRR
jgi:hypothetical protein